MIKDLTFDFLGFTHMCGKNGKTGYFVVRRKTVKKRMRAKLQALKDELRRRIHDPLAETGKWLQTVVRGYYQYYAVPDNIASLGLFRERLLGLWRHVIRRRSQKRPPNWDRLGRFFDRWLPRPCILHPFPQVRFDARHPRYKPYALAAPVRIYAGGVEQSTFLPRQASYSSPRASISAKSFLRPVARLLAMYCSRPM
jgi:RNA-directed DNA polymerase